MGSDDWFVVADADDGGNCIPLLIAWIELVFVNYYDLG